MTPLFDRYLIVDWSAANTPSTGKDSVWIAFAARGAEGEITVETENPPTRAAAMAAIRAILLDSIEAGRRVFAGFDFPFGYPAGAAEAIGGRADWAALWSVIEGHVHDREDNFSNRFEVGGIFNRGALREGPMFWGRPAHQDIPGLPATKPVPYPSQLPERRLCELRAPRAQPVWKLAFAGSVGSQAILGIAHLQALRTAAGLEGRVAVWPFETGFAERLDHPVVLAEIYPALFEVKPGDKSCLDEAEVETLAKGFAGLDSEGRFAELLAEPPDLSESQKSLALREEGWIAGLGHALEIAEAAPNLPKLSYLRDPAAITRESFRIIREEARLVLPGLPPEARDLAIRLAHAAGDVGILADLKLSPGAVEAGRAALSAGAPILVDAEMVAHGITLRELPAENAVLCRLNEAGIAALAERLETTRSAAQVDLWGEELAGAVVAIGNAPTALFRLLERLDEGAPKPALILGFPVGFVGAAESKAELEANSRGVPFVTLAGRRGGSALAAAAVNALAQGSRDKAPA